jgi:peptidyl-prolyl cis-trans isomerase C
MVHKQIRGFLIGTTLLSWVLWLAACQPPPTRTVVTHPVETLKPTTATPFQPIPFTPSPKATSTPVPSPTATPEPLAVQVNGEGITLAEYLADLARYQAAQKETGQANLSEVDQRKAVIDNLVGEVLLAQAAQKAGFKLSPENLIKRIDDLALKAGGLDNLGSWQKQNGYTDQSFRRALARSIAAAWERDQIIAQVPDVSEQVHARQILIYNKVEADTNLRKLKSGVEFATIALAYDRDTGGDLGWFPRGYLFLPEVEAAAFTLGPGGYSEVIQSRIGFHIIQVLERDANHLLSTDARTFLQKQALDRWMEEQLKTSSIVVMMP